MDKKPHWQSKNKWFWGVRNEPPFSFFSDPIKVCIFAQNIVKKISVRILSMFSLFVGHFRSKTCNWSECTLSSERICINLRLIQESWSQLLACLLHHFVGEFNLAGRAVAEETVFLHIDAPVVWKEWNGPMGRKDDH